jgi:hypothetical protein
VIILSIEDVSTTVTAAVVGAFASFVSYLPQLIGGLIILAIGLVLGAIVYRVILGLLKAVRLEKMLSKYGISEVEGHEVGWSEILAELGRWLIIIVFLVPALQTWQLNAVNSVLSQVILYLPHVIIAVILVLVGLVFAKLAYKITYNSSKSLGKSTAHTVALVAKWSILIFIGFLVLDQLGVAQELLRILFAGIVAMLALAGGLAFGLGGQGVARNLLESVKAKFNK